MSGPGQQSSDGWQDYTPPAAQAQGWQDYKAPAPTFPAPAGTPTIQKPAAPEMHTVRTLTGTPYNPGRLERGIVDAEGGLARQAADVSTPTIAHRIAQRTGLAGQNSRLYPGEATLEQIPGKAVTTTVGMMGGAGEDPIPDEAPAPRIAAPESTGAPKTSPGMVGRAGEVALRRASRLPGVQAAKDANYILRGPGEVAAPETPAPTRIAKPVSEQSALENNKDFGTPQSLRGKMIPKEPPELTTETRTLPGMIGREVIRPKTAPAPELPPRNGPLLLPSHGDAILKDMQPFADKIMREGHGEEIQSADEPIEAPANTNLEEDLTPALKASLARVRAAKASRIARPN